MPVPPYVTITTDEGSASYGIYAIGHGVTENYVNPGNSGGVAYSPIVTPIFGVEEGEICAATERCAVAAFADHGAYLSFDLHYLSDKSYWECVQFYNSNTQGSYFNKYNSTVNYAFGYSV